MLRLRESVNTLSAVAHLGRMYVTDFCVLVEGDIKGNYECTVRTYVLLYQIQSSGARSGGGM